MDSAITSAAPRDNADADADAGRRWTDAIESGDLGEAARVSDQVLATRDPGTRDDPALPYHLRWVWNGRTLAGRDVLVRCYHGLGDTLQFCRYLPLLARHARRVTVETQPELLPLLRSLPGVARWIGFDAANPVPPSEVDVEVMELMHAFPVLPAAVPYLPVSSFDVGAVRGELGGGFLVGLCWQAGGWDPARSIALAELSCALPPAAAPVLLQRGPAAAPAHLDVPGGFAFRNPDDWASSDVLRTARLLAACDAVVSVDTMVAHLAGALGRPTALLLRASADWRWRTSIAHCRHVSPWYPTMRLFRQEGEGDWSAPLQGLRAWLAERWACSPARASLSGPLAPSYGPS